MTLMNPYHVTKIQISLTQTLIRQNLGASSSKIPLFCAQIEAKIIKNKILGISFKNKTSLPYFSGFKLPQIASAKG